MDLYIGLCKKIFIISIFSSKYLSKNKTNKNKNHAGVRNHFDRGSHKI